MYNFNHLYYFYVTAKAGGVNSAAKHLGISQPSLSSQLKVLEETLDQKLFQKVGRKNQLTQAGLTIFGFCKKMFELSEAMNEVISDNAPTSSRKIHLGISSEVDPPFVTEVVSRFLRKHPDLDRPKIALVSGTHEQLTDRLRFRELDCVVSQMASISSELVNLNRAELPVTLACSTDYELPENRKFPKNSSSLAEAIGSADLAWIMPSLRYKIRSETDQFFEKHHLQGRIVFESDVTASLIRSVVDGIGLAFLPTLYFAREIEEKSVRVVGPKSGFWKYRIWLSCHGQSRDDGLVNAFSESFAEICSQASS